MDLPFKAARAVLTTELRRRLAAAFLFACLSSLVFNAFHAAALIPMRGADWLGQLEMAVYQDRLNSGPNRPNADIVVVSLDRSTPEKLHIDPPFLPLPRSYHGRLIRLLRDAGARELVIDLIFSEQGNPQQDDALEQALRESAPMHISLAANPEKMKRDYSEPGSLALWFAPPVVAPEPLPANITLGSPVAFDPGGVLAGAILVQRDRATQKMIPHLALAAVLGLEGVAPDRVQVDSRKGVVSAGGLSWTVNADGVLLPRWIMRRHAFTHVEYAEALRLLATAEGKKRFKNKIVLLGDASGNDDRSSPLGQIPGTEFLAQVVNTLLLPGSAEWRRWTIPQNALWGGLLAFLCAIGVGTLRFGWVLAGFAGALSIAYFLPGVALVRWHTGIDTAAPCFEIIMVAVLTGWWEGGGAHTMARRFTPRHVREMRSRQVTEEATILFVDLKGSTSMAEAVGPIRAQELLSNLLRTVSTVINKSGGDVERTMGDGLMAVFRKPGHPLKAVRTVAPLTEAVERMNVDWQQRYGVTAGVTLGLESGVISGAFITAGDREEWSSFGPPVNMAARVQAACAGLGVSILLAPAVRAMVQHEVPTEYVATVELKGIEEPTPVYTLSSPTAAVESFGPPP